MKIVSYHNTGAKRDGKNVIEAVVVADTTPATLPTTGANVEGMSPDDVFAPMSVLYVVADVEAKVYIANESGVFVAQ